jgi:hypothetical protein
MIVLLEQIKLELWTILPKISELVRKAREKNKPGL